VIFGKNSDRGPYEAHELILIPQSRQQYGKKVSCTYIDFPQVRKTNAVFLVKPFWISGAEWVKMRMNKKHFSVKKVVCK